MTTIINDVDVSGCEFYDNGKCSAQQQFAEGELLWIEKCNDTPDCYYKQLQRAKQELQKFQDMAKKGLEEFKDVGGCWGCGLQLQLNQDIEDIKQLKAENAELKAKIKKYAAINEQETKDYAELNHTLKLQEQENVRLREKFNNLISTPIYENCNLLLEQKRRLEKCLQEIKTIAEDAYENNEQYQSTGIYNDIIEKVNGILEEQTNEK